MSDHSKVLVVGSNSFSGSDFIDLLMKEGRFDVIGVSRSPQKKAFMLPEGGFPSLDYTFYQIDMNKNLEALKALVDDFQPDYIVNFAAQSEVAPSWENPAHWYQTNLIALTEFFRSLQGKKFLKNFVHISSPEAYGSCHGIVKEESALNPSTPYAVSKAAGDFSLLSYHRNCGIPLTIIRSTNVYGARQQLFKIIPRSVINIKLGCLIELHGGGEAVKSYIHIRDVSRGELLVMERGRLGEIYHLSPEKGIAVRDVVRMICKMLKVDFRRATRDVEERLGQDAAYVIDSSKASQEFGWKPEISIESGLKEVVEWVEKHWNKIEEERLEYIHKA